MEIGDLDQQLDGICIGNIARATGSYQVLRLLDVPTVPFFLTRLIVEKELCATSNTGISRTDTGTVSGGSKTVMAYVP